LQDKASLSSHHEELQVASCFGFKARGRKRQGEEKKTSLPLLHVQGKKKKKHCRLKTAPFHLSFFFFQLMKRRRFSQNAPFHLNENWRQSARLQVNPSICARVSFWSLVSDFFN
jgi:hypothetical protein